MDSPGSLDENTEATDVKGLGSLGCNSLVLGLNEKEC